MPVSDPIAFRRWWIALLGSLALLGSPVMSAQDDAAEWFVRMTDAMRTEAYEGTLVYGHGDRIETMELLHGNVDGTEYERLRVLNGQPFEILREGTRVTCIWPSQHKARTLRRPGDPLAPRPPSDLRELPDQYRASAVGDARVAGRDAQVIHITAADEFRYGYRMWIDRATGLLLRSDLVDGSGKVYERFMFTRLEPLESVSVERFQRSLEGMEYTRHDDAPDPTRLDNPEWQVGELPSGFQLVSHRSEAMPPHGMAVQHSVYTDGLASVSVFIEPPDADAMPLEGLSRMGAVHAFGRRADGHQVTVVGEVPAATVERIATSVRRVRGD